MECNLSCAIFDTVQTVWKGVRAWSRRFLEKAGARVMDVQGPDQDDDGDDDADEADDARSRSNIPAADSPSS